MPFLLFPLILLTLRLLDRLRWQVPRLKLTKAFVDRARVDVGEDVFWDSDLRGFGLRVKASGSKSYIVQYRDRRSGRSRRPRRTTAGRGLPLRNNDHATRPRGPDSSLETARSCPTSGEHLSLRIAFFRNFSAAFLSRDFETKLSSTSPS